MPETGYLNIWGWFILGLSMGVGPCVAHHFFLVLPYISLNKKNTREGWQVVVYFSVGRIISLTLLGFLSGLVGGALYANFMDSGVRDWFIIFLGLFLVMMAAAVMFFEESFFCKKIKFLFDKIPGDMMLATGFLTPLLPCPVILGFLAYTAAGGQYIQGALSGLGFGLGTAVSPILIAGPLLGFFKKKISGKIRSVLINLGGLILFGYGLHLILSVLL